MGRKISNKNATFQYSIIPSAISLWQGRCEMKRLASFLLIVGIWAVLASGCTWAWSKDTIVRCPKCSTVFSVDEDIRMRQLRE